MSKELKMKLLETIEIPSGNAIFVYDNGDVTPTQISYIKNGKQWGHVNI